MIDFAVLLSLLTDKQTEVLNLRAEVERLREALRERKESDETDPADAAAS